MKNFNWEKFKKGGIAVHCDTEEKANDFLNECDKKTIVWLWAKRTTEYNNWNRYSSETGYRCNGENELGYAPLEYYKNNRNQIVQWEIDEKKEEKRVYKIQDLLKEELVGREATHDGEIFTVTGDSLITCYGEDIEDCYNMRYILNAEFELVPEEKQKAKTKGYLANGLFGLGDRLVNELLAKEIRESVDVDLYLPQENFTINNKQAYADSKQIYEGDLNYLNETDFLVAVIDGCEIDSGTAAEIAIISTMGKKIYALYTDTRQQGTENQSKIEALVNDPTENQFMYRNLFVIGLIKKHGYIFDNIEDLVKQLKEDIEVI